MENTPLKLSYLSGISNTPLLGITIGDQFDQTVAQYPNNDALIVYHQDIRWTYQQLQQEVNRCARAFMTIGLQKGDRIGIWAPNRYEWLVTQIATAKIGAILVNINPSYRVHELKYALNQSGCKMLVTADQFKQSDYTQMLYELAPELNTCPAGQLKSKELPQLTTVLRLHADDSPGMYPWSYFIEAFSEDTSTETLAVQQAGLAFDEPINIQYTSGTTGYPKGATLSHHNILNNGYFVARTMNFTEKDRLIIPVPLYHCFGMVMGNLGCITHGATMIYPSEGFEPDKVLQAAEQEKATAIYGVPTMFIAELEHPNFDKHNYSSLRTGIMAGSPCPIEVMKQVQSRMHMNEVQIAYGMTETSPVSTQTRIGTPLEKQVSTVGQIHPHLEVKVIDPETGKVNPVNTAGELCTRGYSVMLGYWNDEEKTRQAIDNARWMHTGDLATIDEDGYINIVGRIKDMIIRGGENVYPREIEEFLYTHPDISDVQVIGVPDKKYGEEIMAWIKLKEGKTLTLEDIKAFCQGKIAHFKIPRYVKFTDEFPMTVTGKIRKVEMRKVSMQELGLESEKMETA
ncbi:MAG TPA: AMP-binding protein [Microscillaceae bacterium]|nr:AMP-binding protein [Microscillaceae bacterium]